MAIDIIVPIYNAFDDLQKCINSVLQYTDLQNNRLILINDCSPDERIAPYIDSLKKYNIFVFHNEKNKGFSGNVNLGFSLSDVNDVLLLNTDTVVSAGWLDKMQRCAYRDPWIGTVTPLSNSATICSVPEYCVDNPLPQGYSVDEFAALVEKYSLRCYPDISVAIGFCMYIKREVIQKVGDFDAATFQRGYGEENDFCNRAVQYGYRHVLCDDTFVFHGGTASFVPDEKKALIEAHDVILRQRYPAQMEYNDYFVMSNPLRSIQQNIKIRMLLNNGRKNILYLVQRDFRPDADDYIGGTQFHVKDLKNGLCHTANIFVMARDKNYMRLTIYSNDESFSFKFRIGNPPAVPTVSIPEHKALYELIINAFHIDLVHIHHVYQLSMDLFTVAHEMHIPLVATLHDFYFLCPTIKLLDEKNHCCFDCTSTSHCTECLLNHPENRMFINGKVNYIDAWREQTLKHLSYCDQLITPSEEAKRIYTQYWPKLSAKISVIPHGIDTVDSATENYLAAKGKYQALKCCCETTPTPENASVAGWAFVENKPSGDSNLFVCFATASDEYLVKASVSARSDVAEAFGAQYLQSGFRAGVPLRYQWEKATVYCVIESNGSWYKSEPLGETQPIHSMPDGKLNVAFVGGISAAKGSRIAVKMIEKGDRSLNWFCIGASGDHELRFMNQKNYYYSHWYQREELSGIVRALHIDVICILPIWPETFCYVLSEALAAGVPVIATDIGALKDRVRDLQCGWVVPVDSAVKDALSVLKRIEEDRTEYNAVQKHIRSLQLRDVRAMAEDYVSLYDKLYHKVKYNDVNFSNVLENELTAAGTVGSNAELLSSLAYAENELQRIQSGNAYKISQALLRMNIPFRKQVKSIVVKTARLLKIR